MPVGTRLRISPSSQEIKPSVHPASNAVIVNARLRASDTLELLKAFFACDVMRLSWLDGGVRQRETRKQARKYKAQLRSQMVTKARRL